MIPATFWQNATMLLVCLSFIAANFGSEPAMKMWEDGAAGIGVFMAVGIGAKMVHRTSESYIQTRYGSGKTNVDRGV